MIVGTAGHIDHGKTTLVRALTGVDTDRLPEEKARGISIELGYAFLDVPGMDGMPAAGRIGFIDVPGHERLVHTMMAGATGIDFGLLLVAADDGVMPQTREHLAVLSLLGLSRGAVVITKVDRADAARVAQVGAEVRGLMEGSALCGAPVLAVSAQAGAGIAPLRDLLFDAARHTPPREVDGMAFRLAVDRVFTLAGTGTVVTGTVHAGRVRVGDEIALTPSAAGARARVRSVHAQNQATGEAVAGQRCALALAGVAKDAVARGDWVVAPAAALATDRLDAALTLWHAEARALRSGTPVHVHVGARETLGTVAILQMAGGAGRTAEGAAKAPEGAGDALAPGRRAHVQIVLREPIGAWHGDRVLLRDASASRTLAGGTVLDPFAPARYRRTPQRLAELGAWSLPDAAARLAALIDAAPTGVALARWARAEGRTGGGAPIEGSGSAPVEGSGGTPALPGGTLLADIADASDGAWALGAAHRSAAEQAALAALQTFHAREPEMPGPDAARLRRLAAPRLPEPLWRALLADLQARRLLAVRGAFVHLPEHDLRLSAADERLAQKIAPLLSAAGFEGSWARDLARDSRESEALLRTTLARMAQRGELHQVVRDLCYPPAAMARLAAHVRAVAEGHDGAVTAARFRDATGLGRKRAIQILEYFDRVGLLRRVGNAHRLRTDTAMFIPGAPSAR